ncbi:MAG: hypothetical protein COB39_04005 [Marinosulfonomonas sp.]|nr:MAG: hypothetical protein COB39_04005 [Marinosulfonomonas sp.]
MKYLISILLLIPSLAFAGSDIFANCAFTQECLEGEACEETSFEMVIEHADDIPFVMQTMAENIEGYVFDNGAPDATSTLMGQTKTATHLLSLQAGGAARYTVHMQGPMAITYQGTREVMN